jgi:CRISPR-associated protein Cas6
VITVPAADAVVPLRGDDALATVDLYFSLAGDFLPADYAVPLEAALLGTLPWLAAEPLVGVHPIRAARDAEGLVLSRRSRLKLRAPTAIARRLAGELEGAELSIESRSLRVGAAVVRPVGPYATLKAAIVALPGVAGEVAFMAAMARELDALGVAGEMICSRPAAVGGGTEGLHGFGVVVHDLSPRHSVLLQARGIGPGRRLGCGLFVHHKLIEGLDAYPE